MSRWCKLQGHNGWLSKTVSKKEPFSGKQPQNQKKHKLEDIRQEIDMIDSQIIDLLAKRFQCAEILGDHKKVAGIPIKDKVRENEVLNKVKAKAQSLNLASEPCQSIVQVYKELLEQSCRIQEIIATGTKNNINAESVSTVSAVENLPEKTPFPVVLFIGLGLIGGALARSCRQKLPDTRVLAIDKAEIVNQALNEGIIDGGSIDASHLLSMASLVVLCASPEQNLQILKDIAPRLHAGQVVMDVGSTKSAICNFASTLNLGGADFVGGHPFFGSEKSGFEASAELAIEDKAFCLSPNENTSEITLKRLQNWLLRQSLLPVTIDAARHDLAAARHSHLVQLMSIALGASIAKKYKINETETMEHELKVSGPSLRQMTRLMSSPPALWSEILIQNKEPVDSVLKDLVAELITLAVAIKSEDRSAIEDAFTLAASVSRLV